MVIFQQRIIWEYVFQINDIWDLTEERSESLIFTELFDTHEPKINLFVHSFLQLDENFL